MEKTIKGLAPEERLREITLEENQGGDLSSLDYFWYVLFGVVLPISILVWGWF
jgi:hypothetical protein